MRVHAMNHSTHTYYARNMIQLFQLANSTCLSIEMTTLSYSVDLIRGALMLLDSVKSFECD
jgi:hypothetical protein